MITEQITEKNYTIYIYIYIYEPGNNRYQCNGAYDTHDVQKFGYIDMILRQSDLTKKY